MKNFLLITIVLILSFNYSVAQTINAPSELEAQNEKPFYIKVKWNDNSSNENGFYVERATSLDTANWEVLGGVGQNVRIFNDYWITLNKRYFYRAYAYNENGRSDYSNIDTIIAAGDTANFPGAPSELRITNITMTSITINWNDNSNNEAGFIIARRRQGEVQFEYIDTVQTDVLTYQEVGLTPDNIYYYKVCSYNLAGTSDFTNTVSGTTKSNTILVNNSSALSDGYFLSNNFPNPFNPATTIKFGLPSKAYVTIKIYNAAGKEVESLINSYFNSGIYSIVWNASGFPSSAYFYKIETENFTEVKKMILTK
ncbi:MAG: T9SS type A sorting domain-containing protein [Ignavibacteria bacterium]|nr:T9SS type A sorting domain-containing protein [Ignavibacteria bacterium]